MDRYLEFRLRPDPEFVPMVLMNALFAKLHRGLVTLRTDQIGVSFPDVDQESLSLGERLRLHGSAAELERLMSHDWLRGMNDLVRIQPASSIPDPEGHRVVRRVQADSNPERLRRRRMRRKGEDRKAALQAVPDSAAEYVARPFVSLKSQSTGHHFRLFIEHGPVVEEPVPGRFSTYGLSSTATIPWF